MSSLTTSQFKQLQSALLDAFPDRGQLTQMVFYSLEDKNLDEIADHGANLSRATWQLIQWAKSRGKISDLISGAVDENPENPKLKKFYQEWKAADQAPSNISKPTPKLSRNISKPNSKLPRKISAPSPSFWAPRKSIDDGLGFDSVSSSDKKSYHTDDMGWIVYDETTKLSCQASPQCSRDMDCSNVTKVIYIVEWDVELEHDSGAAVNIWLEYSYQNELKRKRVTLVYDSFSAQAIRKKAADRTIVVVAPSFVGTIDTEHVLLEYSIIDVQLTNTSHLPINSSVMEAIEIGFRLRCKE